MNDAFTCKVDLLGRAPKRIELLGDRKRPESAQHIIEFPGGAIEVSRTAKGEYWAHVHINRDWSDPDMKGVKGAIGRVVCSRLGTDEGVLDLPVEDRNITQIAVLIATGDEP